MVVYIRSDLEFILQQIFIAEQHAAGTDLSSLLPNAFVPFGLRTVDGTFNNVVTGQSLFGAADQQFPRMTEPDFRDADAGTSYEQTSGIVVDTEPRTISNLIVDQTISNPAAVQVFVDAGFGVLDGSGVLHYVNDDGSMGDVVPPDTTLTLPNVMPDAGLSAPFNLWFVLFGQFFDHGLDLVTKGGSGTVFIPLMPDDPLYNDAPGSPNFLMLTRATNDPGADGILGDDPTTLDIDESADDLHEHTNTTTPFVDQNQTYTSTPSHQVFLRAYQLNGAGEPVATGKLITNRDLGDGTFGNADDVELGGMATWAVVKAQARDLLGIELTDYDALNVPRIHVDPYGNFIPGPNGFAQFVIGPGADGIVGTLDDDTIEGNPAAPISAQDVGALRTGHMFLADIAHEASPFGSNGAPLLADTDDAVGLANSDASSTTGFYDDELLDAHFMAGDGRANENIGLTAVHHVFHAEHNRLVDHTKAVLVTSSTTDPAASLAVLNGYLDETSQLASLPVVPPDLDLSDVDAVNAFVDSLGLVWNGERLFQAARFGTEMQYQHLVFEEFARKVQPNVDEFLAPEGFAATIDPAIVAEFAHTVYRFGHSMLLDTIDRLDPNFASSEIGLIEAFLNPLAYDEGGTLTADEAAGAIVRGTTRQVGNEIDEMVTDVLRNNLLGLPLDLATINIARGRDTGIPSLNAARREFYEMTADSQLKPYISWVDFAAHLKHPEALVNFIAAYGTHESITTATTLADKRIAADLLVFGGAGEPLDRLAFLNGPAATTGVDDIDLWIGGLAEQQMPFGGLLGSTFNFVFETQLENLQNGDRFYYLARTAGMHFITELENNSFAKLVMLNTDATHLPADIFSTPTWILEVDRSKQFTGLDDPSDTDLIVGNSDPTEGGTPLIPLVIRDNPATAGADSNYLHYTGVDHVVLGGTDGDDIMIASIGDDTIWGDGGNDRIEGGDGVDNIEGGAGDDIITDWGGDDTLKGNEGNDVIQGGNGLNLLLGGEGHDFIITGEDVSTTFGGEGNDFILGSQMNLPTMGNEGDDWIEIGTSDGAGGDNFDPQEASTVIGHDVFITGGGFDEVDGEGGDDIMVFSDGEDHFGGGGGFDWASYKFDPFGVTADLLVNDFIEPLVTPSNQGIIDRFAEVEGLSGSSFSDILRGDNADAVEINVAGALNSALNQEGIDRIAGLQALLGAGVTSFFSGNIILGGDGSDIIEGRGGDDLIDGDLALNVRVSVRANPDGTGAEIATFDTISNPTLIVNMLNGTWNPGQLQIVREILPGTTGAFNFDTAVFSGVLSEYQIIIDDNVLIGDTSDDIVTVTDLVVGRDGVDVLKHIERLQFSPNAAGLTPQEVSGKVVLVPGLNADPNGVPTIDDTTPAAGQTLTASIAGVTDADNVGPGNATGAITGRVSYIWQVERDAVAAPGVFEDILDLGGANPGTAVGPTFRITPDLAGLALRVKVVYQDANGVLETVFSTPTQPVAATLITPPAPVPAESSTTTAGIHLIRADLQFILDQILLAEAHTDGNIIGSVPNTRLPFGLRTVDGSFNNLLPGQTEFGASDNNFPLLLDQNFRNDLDGDTMPLGPPGSGAPTITNTNYASTVSVADADPRLISNLIVDQTITNPVAVQAFVDAGQGILVGGVLHYLNDDGSPGAVVPPATTLTIPNVTPDEGLSAPFNSWFTFFGQFFDHGLDLVDKGNNGTIYIPLQPDDPLYVDGGSSNFMVLSRATNVAVHAGDDGLLGTSDDVHFHNNETTPFVDQNQTYTSHASHQVFLREYEFNSAGDPVNTGRLIDGANGGIANWAEVKAQAATFLGIQLTDFDVHDVPLLATDAYGRFIPGPNGFPQFVVPGAPGGHIEANPADNGGLGTLVPAGALRSGHAFLNDIAHDATPVTGLIDPDRNPGTNNSVLMTADTDEDIGNVQPLNAFGVRLTYDDELLDKHFVTGDGRGNENIGLTAVHFIFHAEHNRLVGHIKDVAIASNDASFLNNWLITPVDTLPTTPEEIADLEWNGERLFQAARFSTEMQYQHLVFEEFARKVQPQVDVFLAEGQGYDSTINPAIVAEFAHTVYRFGHSMLPETVERLDANFNLVNGDTEQIGLIEAFLNPLEFTASGATDAEAAGAIIRGVTRQVGNEIDEFVTEAVRNNLLGLPLDLAAINLARGRDTGVPPLNEARAEFFSWTGDSQLKPYTSWVDFALHLRHPESLVNFVAAYGTHGALTAADVDTFVEKRAVATALVFGGDAIINAGTPEERTFTADEVDRLDFLNSTGDWASNLPDDPLRPKDVDGVSTTGLGSVDLWIGGLAEKQMPFGGLLGSTFNYVFENQMEKLQNGDRFYYLERTAGLNFLTELENNSFAKLIMANTDTTHLPGDVFSTPAFILEVDPTKQFTGLGPDGKADPEGDNPLIPLVIRDNPATLATNDSNYLHYTGEDHVVLGGTSGDDIIISSVGDDTLYGDAGNDRLEGGDGVDMILGGAGNDIITDRGGEDNLQGGDGDDAINGGNSIDLILAGFGNDFVVTGEDGDETFGGPGDDFILGDAADEMVFGNEGDDWIEGGMADGSAGENFDTRGLDSIIGNDVFIGIAFPDRMNGEGGDDIMAGNGGQVDRYIGGSGFDWAIFKSELFAANVDLNLRAFDETPLPQQAASALARFESAEGLSGSSLSDILRGDDSDAAAIAASGFRGSILTNFDLIVGLRGFVGEAGNGADGDLGGGDDQFGAGNIILGGSGSDIIEGRGGDDLIDGDLWLNVRISVRTDVNDPSTEFDSADSMTELVDRIFSGEISPGQLKIVRELLPSTGFNFDTAEFSGNLADYTIAVNGTIVDPADLDDLNILDTDVVTVTHVDAAAPNGIGIDGVDRLTHIERLQFNDQSVVLRQGLNFEPEGNLAILDNTSGDPVDTPETGQVLRVSIAGVTDGNNVSPTNPGGTITGPVTYVWQFEPRPGTGVFEDIVIATGLGDVRATGETFTVTDDLAGLALRVQAIYQDANGVLEQVFSDVTEPVVPGAGGVAGAPVVADLVLFPDLLVDGPIEDTPFDGTLAPFATDPNGDALTFSVVDDPDPLAGDVVLNPDGTFTFTPAENFFGDVTFTFIVNDGLLDSNLGTVLLTVASVDDAPVVGDPVVLGPIAEDTQDFLITTADLVASVVDVDTPPFLLQAFNLVAATGTLIDNLDGTWTFTPDANDDTAVDFTYDVFDGSTLVTGFEATLDLIPANEVPNAPVLGNNTVAEFAANGTLVGTLTATDPDGDPLTLELVDNAGGRFTLVGTQILVASGILLDFEQNPSHVIQVQVSDGISAPVLQSFTINVADVNPEILTGTAAGDTLFGGAGADRFNGAGGNDVLRGNEGADRLEGGAGNDTIQATEGDGADRYDGGAGTDTLDLSLTDAPVNLNLGARNVTSADIGTDRIDGFENAIGTQGNDTLGGTGGANFIDGQGGNDTINSGNGNDTVLGGAGNDTINGGGGNDSVNGESGDDTINVGTGNDTIVVNAGFGNDRILSFDANAAGGQDLIDLRSLGITSLTFGSVTIADAGADTLVTIGSDGTLRLVGVTNHLTVTSADFILLS